MSRHHRRRSTAQHLKGVGVALLVLTVPAAFIGARVSGLDNGFVFLLTVLDGWVVYGVIDLAQLIAERRQANKNQPEPEEASA